MKYKGILVVVPCFLPMVAAQDDPLSILVSEAYSVYTEATQILSSVVSAVTADPSTSSASTTSEPPSSSETTTSSTSSDTFSTTPSSPSSSPSSYPSSSASLPTSSPATTSSSSSKSSSSVLRLSSTGSSHAPTTLSPSALGTSSVVGATEETGTSLPTLGGSSHDHKLEIILGSVLGALALGLFILALLLCRKRRHGQSARHRALSPGDDEVESWRLNRQSDIPESKTSSRLEIGASGSAPLMSEHPAFRGYEEHENPFIPVPPPPRRTAPNSRAVLTDGMVGGDEPFVNEKEVEATRPTSWPKGFTTNPSPKSKIAAAGLTGAAIGAGLMHQHRRSNDEKDPYPDEKGVEPQVPRQIHRKPVPINSVNDRESWPASPVLPIDPVAETTALSRFSARTSDETQKPLVQNATRNIGDVDKEYPLVNGQQDHHSGKTGAELAAGALAATAIARHSKDNHSGTRGRERAHRQSPMIDTFSSLRRISNDSYGSTSSENRNSYSDVLPSNPYHDVLAPEPALAHGPERSPANSPSQIVAPVRSPRRHSNGGAPVYNDPNRPAIPSPLSTEVRRDPSRSPIMTSGVNGLPSRRSRASSNSHSNSDSRSRSRYSFEYDASPMPYDTYPPSAGAEHYGGFFSSSGDWMPEKTNTAGNDGRHPPMNGPRHKSGGGQEHEYPQEISRPGHRRDSTMLPPPLPRDNNTSSMFSLDGSDFDPRNIDMDFSSNWRMSTGLPNGWQRQQRHDTSSPRNNGGVGGGKGQRLRTTDVPGRERYTQVGLGQAL